MHTGKSSFRLLPALVCLAAAFWLPTTCWNDLYEYISSAKEVTKTAADQATDQDHTCETDSSGLVSRMNTSEEEFQKHLHHNVSPTRGVLRRHESLFWRQPNVYEVSTGFLRDGKGGWTDTWGITVRVTEKVDQNTLPPEDRIPDLLEGVPMQIVDEEPLPRASESACDYDTCGASSLEREEGMTTTPEITDEYIHEVRLKYDPLFWRQPNVFAVSEGFLRDGRGGWLETSGINVKVTRQVDQSTLPPEDRIPDCLEGVPVRITEGSGRAEFLSLPRMEESNGSD